MTIRTSVVAIAGALASVGFAQQPVPGDVGPAFTVAVPAPAVGFAVGPQENIMYRTNAVAGGQVATFVASEFSFDGAVVKNAPYFADAVTETTQRLADGNRISHKSTSALYRDSEGRTRREENFSAIGPLGANTEPMQTIVINDPVSKTNLVLEPRNKTVRKMPLPEVRPMPFTAGAAAGPMTVRGGLMQATIANRVTGVAGTRAVISSGEGGPASNMKEESLGTQTIEGVRADGTRTTTTIPAGAIGNDLPIEIASERWYSPDLQMVVMTKRSDPRMGDTVYRLTNINRDEPAHSLFEAPSDYTVVEDQFKREILEPLRK